MAHRGPSRAQVVKNRYVPFVALASAFSFLVMMFNVPIPDGTTAHGVAATLIACVLGPWAAVIAVTVALVIQALFFGDGGVLALGANCFNMAFVMPFVGYAIYRVLSRRVSLTSPRRALAAGVGAYAGLNAAALCAAIEFGLQPTLFKAADGTPLYAPFHLSQTIPAMMLAHLTVGGVVEFALTVGVITYLQRANVPLLQLNHRSAPLDGPPRPPNKSGWRWSLAGIGSLVALVPLGLLAPGSAFGENAPSGLNLAKYHLGAVPNGLQHYAGFWHSAILGGYDFKNDTHPTWGYIVSAIVGLAAIALVAGLSYVAVRAAGRRRARRRLDPVPM